MNFVSFIQGYTVKNYKIKRKFKPNVFSCLLVWFKLSFNFIIFNLVALYIRYILTSEHCGHKWTLFSNMRFIAKFITAVCVNVLLPIPIPTHEYFLVCKVHSTTLRFF